MASDMREVAECDWVWVGNGSRLHHPDWISEPDDGEPWRETTHVRATCGIGGLMSIPGIMPRTSTPRCANCCDRLGIPRGNGSPKNDPELRDWLEARLEKMRERVEKMAERVEAAES